MLYFVHYIYVQYTKQRSNLMYHLTSCQKFVKLVTDIAFRVYLKLYVMFT